MTSHDQITEQQRERLLAILTAKPTPRDASEVAAEMRGVADCCGLPHLDERGEGVIGWDDEYGVQAAWDLRVGVWIAVCDCDGVDPYGLALDVIQDAER